MTDFLRIILCLVALFLVGWGVYGIVTWPRDPFIDVIGCVFIIVGGSYFATIARGQAE